MKTATPAPGTRPTGVASEAAAAHVRGMFDQIAPTYDRANHLLSLSVDRYWRWRTVRTLRRALPASLAAGGAPVLDICCGTGDLTLALRAGLDPGTVIVGADFSHAMLALARRKAHPDGGAAPGWLQADAMRLPYPDATFAAITTGFGFRKLSDYRAGLAEFLRVLRPGGVLAILEVARPAGRVLGAGYRLYFERVLPLLGGWISGHPAAYRYLPESVGRFPTPPVLAEWMRAAGFAGVRYQRLAGGIASLHLGTRPGT